MLLGQRMRYLNYWLKMSHFGDIDVFEIQQCIAGDFAIWALEENKVVSFLKIEFVGRVISDRSSPRCQ